jgi:ubiquinone/menaquinone biosynthesis C-methylase UbiE
MPPILVQRKEILPMRQAKNFSNRIQEHYAPPNLEEAILTALTAAGIDINALSFDALAPLDEFHIRGRQATMELAEQLNLQADQHVLDVGSGLGGASRYLASTFGCRVTGLDITEAYCHAAEMLANRLGLDGKVVYQQGSALEIPFPSGSFDVVWTQHASMNIEEKSLMYNEFGRVLKPGGILAMYDILAGPNEPVHFPVPWARVPELSFLISPDDLRRLLDASGFEVLNWRDTTNEGRIFFNNVAGKMRQNGSAPLGFQVFLGPDFYAMAQNTARNLNENRILVIEAIARAG